MVSGRCHRGGRGDRSDPIRRGSTRPRRHHGGSIKPLAVSPCAARDIASTSATANNLRLCPGPRHRLHRSPRVVAIGLSRRPGNASASRPRRAGAHPANITAIRPRKRRDPPDFEGDRAADSPLHPARPLNRLARPRVVRLRALRRKRSGEAGGDRGLDRRRRFKLHDRGARRRRSETACGAEPIGR